MLALSEASFCGLVGRLQENRSDLRSVAHGGGGASADEEESGRHVGEGTARPHVRN
ncbi:hypothetical protein [Corynebacterium sp.]|uniref:hypothetical protein n=1 Tax=Corynebacterium sp. TaxID=1720 RepID=UPI0025C3D456|nr:hypothetical protein [Corynebacterium sp.]